MSAYAVGDLQGCLQPLLRLLKQVHFNPLHDQLWLVGDLVNRGPESLPCLRFIKSLGDSAKVVLGNHDLHLLAVAHGIRGMSKGDTLEEILAADDRSELLDWLAQQPLIHCDKERNYLMVHAGIPPIWEHDEALRYAEEVNAVIRSDNLVSFLEQMYGDKPSCWSAKLEGYDRLRMITNYLTRMRFCTAQGELDLKEKARKNHPDPNFKPWFEFPRKTLERSPYNIIFGHWAALEGNVNTFGYHGLDTGCVWGKCLTLLNLDTQQRYHCKCD